jgi:crotonobetainyl-CoA:carnitine CoA-transferase CaiB-like acyl-CoA transferase
MATRHRTSQEQALSTVRVIEIAGPFTAYCGKLLADLGADVLLVEPSGGADGRFLPPVRNGITMESLSFAYFNTNKRSVVLDLGTSRGRDAFRQLAKTADVLLEDGTPGTLAKLGLDPASLAEINPALVYTSITPYGQAGPYAHYQATDLILMAMGGFLYMGGYPDTEPIRGAGDQAILAGSLFGAIGSLVALREATRTGHGQSVDVSCQAAVVSALENAVQFWDLQNRVRRRGEHQRNQVVPSTGAFRCCDGYVYMMVGPLGTGRYWQQLIEWLLEEGVSAASEFTDPRWQDPKWLASAEAKAQFDSIFLPFTRQHTKQRLYAAAKARGIPFSPVNNTADLLESEQLRARQFFVRLDPNVDGPLAMPGAPYKLSETPWAHRAPAPRLGSSVPEWTATPRAETALGAHHGGSGLPLQGIRVTDFTWFGAGTLATRFLAEQGAEVIKIETSTRIDTLRLSPPFKDGVSGVNRSGYFTERNHNKRAITLNLKHPAGLEAVRRLISRSDIVANNFAPGTMEKLGLSYEDVRQFQPDIIYLAMSMQGQTGPDRLEQGFGLTISALSGLHHLSGLADREPVGTGTNYSDHVPAPCHAAVAVLAALAYRERTGLGQMIDLSQTETMMACLGPAILHYTINGIIEDRRGNWNWGQCPSGVYPCKGDDRWIAISVREDAEWRATASVLNLESLLSDARFGSIAERQRNQAELDRLLGSATESWDALELMNALQQCSVPAGVVQDAADVVERDPQLRARRHWVRLAHAEMGDSLYGETPFKLSLHPDSSIREPSPLLGQHTREVLEDLLGYSEQEVDELAQSGALE